MEFVFILQLISVIAIALLFLEAINCIVNNKKHKVLIYVLLSVFLIIAVYSGGIILSEG